MSDTNTIILLPFLAAFLLSIFRFYFRDNASGIFRQSFLLAAGAMVIALVYLVLGALKILPAYGALEFGVVGLLLLIVSIYRMTQL